MWCGNLKRPASRHTPQWEDIFCPEVKLEGRWKNTWFFNEGEGWTVFEVRGRTFVYLKQLWWIWCWYLGRKKGGNWQISETCGRVWDRVLLRRKTLSLSLAPGEQQSARAEMATGQTSWALDETLDAVSVSNLQDKHKCVSLLLKQLYIYFNV